MVSPDTGCWFQGCIFLALVHQEYGPIAFWNLEDLQSSSKQWSAPWSYRATGHPASFGCFLAAYQYFRTCKWYRSSKLYQSPRFQSWLCPQQQFGPLSRARRYHWTHSLLPDHRGLQGHCRPWLFVWGHQGPCLGFWCCTFDWTKGHRPQWLGRKLTARWLKDMTQQVVNFREISHICDDSGKSCLTNSKHTLALQWRYR